MDIGYLALFLGTLYCTWQFTSIFYSLINEYINSKYPMNPPLGFTTMMLGWTSTKFMLKYFIFLLFAFIFIILGEYFTGAYSSMANEEFYSSTASLIFFIFVLISFAFLFLFGPWFVWAFFWWFIIKFMLTDYACPHCGDTSMIWGMDEYDTFCKNCNIHTTPIRWKK